MSIKYELEVKEVQVLMDYIDLAVRQGGLAQAENALHLARKLKDGYDAYSNKKEEE